MWRERFLSSFRLGRLLDYEEPTSHSTNTLTCFLSGCFVCQCFIQNFLLFFVVLSTTRRLFTFRSSPVVVIAGRRKVFAASLSFYFGAMMMMMVFFSGGARQRRAGKCWRWWRFLCAHQRRKGIAMKKEKRKINFLLHRLHCFTLKYQQTQ